MTTAVKLQTERYVYVKNAFCRNVTGGISALGGKSRVQCNMVALAFALNTYRFLAHTPLHSTKNQLLAAMSSSSAKRKLPRVGSNHEPPDRLASEGLTVRRASQLRHGG